MCMHALLDKTGRLLKTYDPLHLTYLDRDGVWRARPKCVYGRISNELWHQLWLSKQNSTWEDQIAGLLTPIMDNPALIQSISKAAGQGQDLNGKVNIVFQLLITYIQYAAYKKNSEIYASEWDTQAQQERIAYISDIARLVNKLMNGICKGSSLENVFSVIKTLRDTNELFNTVVAIIADEDII